VLTNILPAAAFATLAVDALTPSSAIVLMAARRMAARLTPVFGRGMAAHSVCSTFSRRASPAKHRHKHEQQQEYCLHGLYARTSNHQPTTIYITMDVGTRIMVYYVLPSEHRMCTTLSWLFSGKAPTAQQVERELPIFTSFLYSKGYCVLHVGPRSHRRPAER
jgi:hypothetical protein